MAAEFNAASNDRETVDAEHLEQEKERENERLLLEIKTFCNRSDRERVEHVLLLGKVGAGKSSILNTIIKALSGQHFSKAPSGKGLASSKTISLERFKRCGVAKEDVAEHRSLVKELLPRLPTIFDFSGIEDNNSEYIREILALLLGGYIRPGTTLEALKSLQQEYYVGGLRECIYKESKPEWKITNVVFVQSCRETASKGLIECLNDVRNVVDEKTKQPIYTGDVHVVMTKYDFVRQHSRQFDRSENETISAEEYENIVKEIAKLFSIEGALKNNMTIWTSYTDETNCDAEYPDIDNCALKFIRHIVAPTNPKDEESKAVVTICTKTDLIIRKWYRKQNFTSAHLLVMIVMLILAVMYNLLNSKV